MIKMLLVLWILHRWSEHVILSQSLLLDNNIFKLMAVWPHNLCHSVLRIAVIGEYTMQIGKPHDYISVGVYDC